MWRLESIQSHTIDELEKVQKRATLYQNSSWSQTVLQKLQLPTLVYVQNSKIEVFKIIHGYYDQEGVPHLQLRM